MRQHPGRNRSRNRRGRAKAEPFRQCGRIRERRTDRSADDAAPEPARQPGSEIPKAECQAAGKPGSTRQSATGPLLDRRNVTHMLKDRCSRPPSDPPPAPVQDGFPTAWQVRKHSLTGLVSEDPQALDSRRNGQVKADKTPGGCKDRPQAGSGQTPPSPAETVTLSLAQAGAAPSSPKSAEPRAVHGESRSVPDSVPGRSPGPPGPRCASAALPASVSPSSPERRHWQLAAARCDGSPARTPAVACRRKSARRWCSS